MYVNGKIISAEPMPGMGGGEIKGMMEGINSTMTHHKFYKCHIVLQSSNKKNK
jgi:hypothetical protein